MQPSKRRSLNLIKSVTLESSIWNTDGMTSVALETPLPRSIRDIAPEVPAVVFYRVRNVDALSCPPSKAT